MVKADIKFPIHNTGVKVYLGNLRNAVCLALIATAACYFFHNVPRRNKYANFYSSYDPAASFHRMQKGGYLQSCPPLESDDKKK